MEIDRRKFLKSLGNVAALGLLPPSALRYSDLVHESVNRRKPRIAVFFDSTFPAADELLLTLADLQSGLKEFSLEFLSLDELLSHLKAKDFDLYINPYGSAFPKEAFPIIYKYLQEGGNWLNFGGVPFSRPFRHVGAIWQAEIIQTVYHKKLGITQSFPVDGSSIVSYRSASDFDDIGPLAAEIEATEIYELYCRFTDTKDFPADDGSAGPRDALLRPLVFGINAEKVKICAPIIMIDRLQGACSGGKWIFANFKGKITPKGIAILTGQALSNAIELNVRPSFASYFEGEKPSFTVRIRRPGIPADGWIFQDSYIIISDDQNKNLERISFAITGRPDPELVVINLPVTGRTFRAGLYHIRAVVTLKTPDSEKLYTLQHENGFWVYETLATGHSDSLTTDRTYFYRNGEPYPVTGTTYMTSDVHRKFLFEPNPHRWDEDFRAMREAGINMVRTGFWTGWRSFMLDAGSPNETVLRAMDAFILTAQKYEIPVILTLFAFLPESWGGENAYLDPRSINAQKEFIAAFAQRYKKIDSLIWDLINEPSFCNPQHLWQCRPNYDRFEQSAWKEWLQKRYPKSGDKPDRRSQEEIFRTLPGEEIGLPAAEDFEEVNVLEKRKPVLAMEYHLFAQDMFSEWVGIMAGVIRENGNLHQLITVGQDEGGTTESPNNHFMEGHVDFTCLHNWWLNDDLVWDNIMTKTPGKANLIEETGIMFNEKTDGVSWRTEEDARNLLERKLAISIGAGGAGFIEWIWNTNPYMASDNEAAIGLHRVDGTAKPEYECVRKFAEFFRENSHRMTGKFEEEIVVLIPHSQIYSPRNLSSEATKRSVRALSYGCNIPLRAVSEYKVAMIRNAPAMIIAPSPQTLNQGAWLALMDLVSHGSILFISGPFDLDDHSLSVDRLKELGLKSKTEPVTEEEYFVIDDKEYRVAFRGDKIERVLKAVPENVKTKRVIEIPQGKGKILWAPVPIELSDSPEAIGALYDSVLRKSSVHRFVSIENNTSSILMLPTVFSTSIMCMFVSESDRDETIKIVHHESRNTIPVTVHAQRTVVLFLDRTSGSVISKMGS